MVPIAVAMSPVGAPGPVIVVAVSATSETGPRPAAPGAFRAETR